MDTRHAPKPVDAVLSCPPARDTASLTRGFTLSMLVSGVRCTLTYLVLPFMVPILGFAPGIGPGLGLAVGATAIAANAWSIRRFQRSRHPWRRRVIAVHVCVIALLMVLAAGDIADVFGSAG